MLVKAAGGGVLLVDGQALDPAAAVPFLKSVPGAQLPEGHRAGGGDVQAVHPVGHGDLGGIIAAGDGLGGQAVPLGAEDEGQALFGHQGRVVDGDRTVGQSQGRRLEAEGGQAGKAGARPVGGGFADLGPGHLKDGAHADPHRPAAEGVAAGGAHQHRVDVQGRRRTEDGPDVGGVDDIFQHRHPAGVLAEGFDAGQGGPAEGRQHPAGEGVAGQLGQHLAAGGVDGGVGRDALQNAAGGPVDLPLLHQQGEGRAAGVQRPVDDLGAFGDKDPLFGLETAAQLMFGQPGKDVQRGVGKVGDLDDMGHGASLLQVEVAFARQAVQIQHPFQGGDVGRDVQRVGLEQFVQLVFKGGDEQVERALDALFGFGDVLAVHPLAVQLGVGVQQFEGGGQVVVDELAQLVLLAGVGLGKGKDAGADRFQAGGLVPQHRVGEDRARLMQLAQKPLVLALPGGIGVRLRRALLGGRGGDGRVAPHHQEVGAVVDVGVGPKIAMVDGAFQYLAALLFGDACRGEQLVQGDVVPVAHHFVQLAFQPADPPEEQPQDQCAPAAHDHEQVGKQVVPQAVIDAVGQLGDARKQKQPSQHGAPVDEALPALFGFLLFGGGQVMGLVAGAVVVGGARPGLGGAAGVLGAEVGGVAPAVLKGAPFFFLNVLINGPQDEQNHRQPGRKAQQNQQGDEGDAGKIMFMLRHRSGPPKIRRQKRAVLPLL